MNKVLFTLPWGKAISKTVFMYDDKNRRKETTDAYMKGNPAKYAEALIETHGNASAALGVVDGVLKNLPGGDVFFKNVRGYLTNRLARDAARKAKQS
jgi:hypothetical protein